ncbi:MAG: SDR family oxidoreductase [Caldilineaceae bacterium]|nr:SDR family oxidoreductase [Caldilineaceae bacterium]
MSNLSGQVAIITGAAHGIGRATATLLAGDGVKVAVADIQDTLGQEVVAEISAAGGEALYLHTDVGSHADIQATVEQAAAHFGRLDIVVNNAYWSARGTVEELSEADWDRSMDVMLKAIYLFAKHAFPIMVQGGGGTMVNLASIHGHAAAHRYGVYAAAKAGVINLTRSLAIDYGHSGIRVNAVCPGWIMTHGVPDDPELIRRVAAMYPVGRAGQPLDIAKVIRFLVSDESSFVNGHAIVADGGLTAQLQDSLIHVVMDLYEPKP